MIAARRLTRRHHRDIDRRFLVEGPQAVREALVVAPGEPGSIHELFVTDQSAVRHHNLVALATNQGVRISVVTEAAMTALSETVTPQGIVAVCGYLDTTVPDVLRGRPVLLAVLVEIRDPGNAGVVLRTADAAGAAGVVFTDSSVDPYNGKCVRASAGSLFHPPIVRGARLEDSLTRIRMAGLRVLAADAAGETELDDLVEDGALTEPTAWVFGSEAHGIPDGVAPYTDAVVRIPIHGRAESLNLAAAAAVCLYATARAQRGRPQGLDGRRAQRRS